ncbi:hypothetical protein D3C84_1305580 [compost metagenome]
MPALLELLLVAMEFGQLIPQPRQHLLFLQSPLQLLLTGRQAQCQGLGLRQQLGLQLGPLGRALILSRCKPG